MLLWKLHKSKLRWIQINSIYFQWHIEILIQIIAAKRSTLLVQE